MAQSAAHLVDCVIPRVPVRHLWVLSFPMQLAHPVGHPSRTALSAVADHPPRHCHLSDQTIGTQLQLKSPWRDGTAHIVMSPLELMQRLAALVPRPRLHLIRFHGVLAPHAKLRAQIVPSAPLNAHQACDHHAQISPASPARMRLKPACSSAYWISISNTVQTVAGA